MENLLFELLQSETETEILEFKEAKNQYSIDKLGKYFSALSNEANLKSKRSAWLLLGIDNHKNIVGTNISNKQINEYKVEIVNNTSPSIGLVEGHKVTINGKLVIMLEIPAAPQGIPIAWKGHYYGRDGESLGGLNIEELERIRNQKVASDWSAHIIENATITDLSQEAITLAREQYAEKNKRISEDIKRWSDETFLNKARLTINGKVTTTALLLLGKPEAEHFINPAQAKITWILKDRDGIEKDYAHFTCPFLTQTQQLYTKIRNIKYRYLKHGSLFPDEVEQFDAYTIREALNNCIAHQNYLLGGKINLVENEDGILTFSNSGTFIPKTIEQVIEADAPETRYRNPFLASAMVNLNMIDTIGSGIKRMFLIQKNKFFPLPEYDFKNEKVTVTIVGKVVDINYARKLAQMPDLSLVEIMLLDKVSKKKNLSDDEAIVLKRKNLIEGRKPNFHISESVAKATDNKADYIKQRGIDDEYTQKIIIDYLIKFGQAKKSDFEQILLDKLPDVLDIQQKKNKIKNNLQSLKSKGVISPKGKLWQMSKK